MAWLPGHNVGCPGIRLIDACKATAEIRRRACLHPVNPRAKPHEAGLQCLATAQTRSSGLWCLHPSVHGKGSPGSYLQPGGKMHQSNESSHHQQRLRSDRLMHNTPQTLSPTPYKSLGSTVEHAAGRAVRKVQSLQLQGPNEPVHCANGRHLVAQVTAAYI